MNQTRTLLVFALCFVAFLMWQQWQQDYAPPAPSVATAASSGSPGIAASTAAGAAVPAAAVPAPMAAASSAAVAPSTVPKPPQTTLAPAAATRQLVTVDTDLLHLAIDPAGASIVRADLKAYPKTLHSPAPVRLLSNDPANFYVVQSGLVSSKSPAPNHTAVFSTAQDAYRLRPGSDTLQVDFTWTDPSGLTVTKRYTFKRDSYVVKLEQRVENHAATAWTGNAYRQLLRTKPPEPEDQGFASQWTNPARYSFKGAAWYSDAKYNDLKFDDFSDDPLNLTDQGGWVAMLQAYFFTAWIPPPKEIDHYSTAVLPSAGAGPTHYLIRAAGPAFTVASGTSGSAQARLYLGPKLPKVLAKVAPGLKLAVNYGMLTVIAKPLHWLLSLFHSWVGNWGLAIILLVLLIKALFFKLSEVQYRSMAKMKKLAPKVKALKERFPDDKTKQQQEMMALYKKEKANPAGGCLPMLVQIPVFFGLYYMLLQSVELRHAPFYGWIHDLLAPDPYFVLPAIYAAILIATQFLTPTTVGMDPTQAKIMKFMPVIFAVMFAFFPAGLVLYYVVNGALSLAQQWIITRRIEAEPSKA